MPSSPGPLPPLEPLPRDMDVLAGMPAANMAGAANKSVRTEA
ncbi:hypothetical protein ACFVXW_00015 [Streptomyces sp. NPDC058251]